MNGSHCWLSGHCPPDIPLLCLCDLILMMVLGGGCYHPRLKGWRSEKLHYLPKSCSLRAGMQSLAYLSANSFLGSRNMLGNQSRSKWTPNPLWEQGSTAVVQGWSEWPPGIKVHAAGRYRKRLLFVLAPLAHRERQIPKAWFCLSAFLILPTQHFFRVCRETGVGFHNQVSPVTQNSQPGWVCFLYHISELLCSPLPGLFPFPL